MLIKKNSRVLTPGIFREVTPTGFVYMHRTELTVRGFYFCVALRGSANPFVHT
jgi:hypothetical protein